MATIIKPSIVLFLLFKSSDAAEEVIDLSQTVHVVTIPEPEPIEKDDLPPWSQKVAQGILQGK